MIQLNAAARLRVMAKADEAQARAYLKSLGIAAGKLTGNASGTISFEITPDEVTEALGTLRKKFGVRSKGWLGNDRLYKYEIQPGRLLTLRVPRSGVSKPGVSLTDEAEFKKSHGLR